MNYSFRIGSLFGISIKVHVIFVLLFGLLLGQTVYVEGIDQAVWFANRFLLLFTTVLLHELGHSLVAKAHGIRVHDIILWPLGGIARLAQLPRSPGAEFRIAVAGPCVNFLLLLLLAPVHLVTGGDLSLTPQHLEDWSLLEFLLFINLMMGCFNLIPAFPLDGGRILRALLARWIPFLEATRISVRIGRLIALSAGVYSLLYATSLMSLTFIAVFVWILGGQELRQVEERDRLERAARLGLPLLWPGADPAGQRSEGAIRFLDPGERTDSSGGRRRPPR
ncbi:MAG: site-2 protease family protein [Planctomycetota bacterium]